MMDDKYKQIIFKSPIGGGSVFGVFYCFLPILHLIFYTLSWKILNVIIYNPDRAGAPGQG